MHACIYTYIHIHIYMHYKKDNLVQLKVKATTTNEQITINSSDASNHVCRTCASFINSNYLKDNGYLLNISRSFISCAFADFFFNLV